jgi:hypothetical protein
LAGLINLEQIGVGDFFSNVIIVALLLEEFDFSLIDTLKEEPLQPRFSEDLLAGARRVAPIFVRFTVDEGMLDDLPPTNSICSYIQR